MTFLNSNTEQRSILLQNKLILNVFLDSPSMPRNQEVQPQPQAHHQIEKEKVQSTGVMHSRTISSSSFASLKSVQSFYSVKSGDDSDFYSVCSDTSTKEIGKY